MNWIIAVCIACGAAAVSGDSDLQCTYDLPDVPTDWIHMSDDCVLAMRDQINREMAASNQFLAIGAYFSRDSVNRPGFANFFYDYADEERGHGISLAEYLITRGELTSGVSTLFQLTYPPTKVEWGNVIEALNDAIVVEGDLTSNIRHVIGVCESAGSVEDYALDDWLTAAFLKTQYHNQFELADMISSLMKMQQLHENLGEFFADKELLDADDDDEDDDDEDDDDDDDDE